MYFTADPGTLRSCHGVGYLRVLLDRIGFSETYRNKVLVYKRKLRVTIKKIFVICSVPHHRRRKNFPSVSRIEPGEGDAPFTLYLLGAVNIIDFNYICKIVPYPDIQRNILVRKERLIAADSNFCSALHNSVKALYRISLALVILCEPLYIFPDCFRILVWSPAELSDLRPVLGCQFSFFD